jgi:hypothetical protein
MTEEVRALRYRRAKAVTAIARWGDLKRAIMTCVLKRFTVFVIAATLLSPQSFGRTRRDDLTPLMARLFVCYRAWSTDLAANTCEPATTVVDAAFGSCAKEEEAVLDEAAKVGGPSLASVFRDEIAKEKTERSRYLAIVLQTRISNGRCSGKSN